MSFQSGKKNNCPKQRMTDTDSSSEDDNPFASNVLSSCTIHNCNHSNCANDFPSSSNIQAKSQGERPCSTSCSSMNINAACPAFCNPIPISVCGCSNNSHPAPNSLGGAKRSVIPIIGNSPNALSLPSASTSRNCTSNSGNLAPINIIVPSSGNQQNINANASLSNEAAAAILPAPRASLPVIPNAGNIGNGPHSLNNIADIPRPQMALNQENNAAGNSSGDGGSGPQVKADKIINLPQNNAVLPAQLGNPGPGPHYNWQATMTTVKERFAFLFNNETLSDVHFRVGKGEASQRIPAHKFVLAVGSAVFDAMFYGKLSTRQEEIELPDVEPQAFLSLLRFLYSDEVQIGPETVMTVLYTAKKYAVPALEGHCVDYLKSNLSPDNAFMLLTQARLFDEPQLAALCLDTIDKNTCDALIADGFTDIDHNTLCMVLERDTLRIREAKLFQAVVRWSEAKCITDNITPNGVNQRSLLARALSLVRFPLMTIEEFAQGPAQSNILTDKEIVQLFLYFTVNPKPPVSFLDIPRCCLTGKEQTVCRFQQIESRWGYSGTSDRIRFIVDRRIFVVGFGMYGSIHGPSEYEVTIQIIHTGTGKVCISNDTNFVSDGTVNTFRVMFKEPFEVLPNTNYTAYATLKGPDSHYGTKGVRKISVECPSGDRVTFQFTYAAGNNNGTSVEDGQIPKIIFYT